MKQNQKKWIWAAFIAAAVILISFLSTVPSKTQQSATDTVANQSISAYLTQIGADSWNSVCWLGDPKGRFLEQFRGTSSNPWIRWREKQRTQLWSQHKSCFEKSIQAVVVLFPLNQDVYSLPREESQKLQAEVSELLSQTERGKDHHKSNSTFYLQTGAQLLIFSRKDLTAPAFKTSSAPTE